MRKSINPVFVTFWGVIAVVIVQDGSTVPAMAEAARITLESLVQHLQVLVGSIYPR